MEVQVVVLTLEQSEGAQNCCRLALLPLTSPGLWSGPGHHLSHLQGPRLPATVPLPFP